MKKMVFGLMLVVGCCGAVFAQAKDSTGASLTKKDGSPLPSPRKMAEVDLSGTKITISYGAPGVKGRKIMGGLVPYGQWWRTGANEATSFQTTGDVMIGDLHVPAGKYTLVTIPAANEGGAWQLVVCKKTGQWGTERFEADDLGKARMTRKPMPNAQETMSIGFEKTMGGKTQLHVKWENTDVYVPVMKM